MDEQALRRQLVAQLEGGQAYSPVEEIIRSFPEALAGKTSGTIGHTAWQLLEHLRIAQWDILHFTHDPKHVTPPWPDEHWPKTAAPPNESAWHESVETFLRELAEVKKLALSPATMLDAEIPHGTGQTYVREVLLVADHNAYHLGQMMQLRRALEGGEAEG